MRVRDLKGAPLSVVVNKNLTIAVLIVARRSFLSRDIAVRLDHHKPAVRRNILGE